MIGLQLHRALEEADYLDSFQLDFRLDYRTETILIALVGDSWWAWDGGSASILAFLALSAVFNAIDHILFIYSLDLYGCPTYIR